MSELERDEIQSRYRKNQLRAVGVLVPFLVAGAAAAIGGRFLPESPLIYSAMAHFSSVAFCMAGLVAFILARKCPACGCRAAVTKRSRRRCRRCGVKLV
jgi:hypothetical protein